MNTEPKTIRSALSSIKRLLKKRPGDDFIGLHYSGALYDEWEYTLRELLFVANNLVGQYKTPRTQASKYLLLAELLYEHGFGCSQMFVNGMTHPGLQVEIWYLQAAKLLTNAKDHNQAAYAWLRHATYGYTREKYESMQQAIANYKLAEEPDKDGLAAAYGYLAKYLVDDSSLKDQEFLTATQALSICTQLWKQRHSRTFQHLPRAVSQLTSCLAYNSLQAWRSESNRQACRYLLQQMMADHDLQTEIQSLASWITNALYANSDNDSTEQQTFCKHLEVALICMVSRSRLRSDCSDKTVLLMYGNSNDFSRATNAIAPCIEHVRTFMKLKYRPTPNVHAVSLQPGKVNFYRYEADNPVLVDTLI